MSSQGACPRCCRLGRVPQGSRSPAGVTRLLFTRHQNRIQSNHVTGYKLLTVCRCSSVKAVQPPRPSAEHLHVHVQAENFDHHMKIETRFNLLTEPELNRISQGSAEEEKKKPEF